MSREIPLLKKVWEDLDGDRDNYNMLCEEIEELLAQTEQTEQEPWRLSMTEAEKMTYEALLKSLREDSQHRTHHLDKLERFIAVVNIRINNAIPEHLTGD